MEAVGLENEIFLMKINVNACTLENFSHIFSSVSWTPTRKISANQTLPWWILPWKIFTQNIPTWTIPTHVFKHFHTSFLFFFHYCHRYQWYYLTDCFVILCFKRTEVFKFVNICQNKVLSEEKKLMKWVGIFQVRIFWEVIFRGAAVFEGKFWWVQIFRVGIPPGRFS